MPEAVLDEDELLRRVIFADPNYVRPDFSVSPMAFRPRKTNGATEKGLSVDIRRHTTLARSIVDQHRFRLYSVRADDVRQIGLDCIHDPMQDNYAHALIVGNLTNSNAKKLSQMAVRVPYP